LDPGQGAEEHRFSTLAVLDRLVCDGSEPLVALAAAAAVTDRIRLATQVLIPGYRGNTALPAKQAATIHQLSEGRLVLGVAAGIRPDDYEVSGADFHRRGRELDRQLEELASIWNDSVIGSRLEHGHPQSPSVDTATLLSRSGTSPAAGKTDHPPRTPRSSGLRCANQGPNA
jgi:alkanesulfonate monooxygenase SsuD/methylene tetrahydromethanopterin reductase-like flavin-dependent oxidoreductase (luciferase family)